MRRRSCQATRAAQVLYPLPEQQLVVYRAGETVQLLHSTLYGAWNSIAEEAWCGWRRVFGT